MSIASGLSPVDLLLVQLHLVRSSKLEHLKHLGEGEHLKTFMIARKGLGLSFFISF